jgi:hypothetical protein
MANVVVVVKTSMSAAASTPVYFATIGAAARSVTVSRWALTPAQAFSPYRGNAGREVRAPLTVRALAWYRERRCQDRVTDARASDVHIKAGL